MTIADGQNLKGVQEILLPNDVVAMNIFYFKAGFIAEQPDSVVAGGMESFVESFYGTLATMIEETIVLGDLQCYVRGVARWDLIKTRTPDVTFTNIEDILAHGVSALLRAYTENPRTIGRKYIPGFTETNLNAGAWSAGALTALANAAAAWITNEELSTNNELLPGIWSTTGSNVEEMTGQTVIPVFPGYQRRRRPGVGI